MVSKIVTDRQVPDFDVYLTSVLPLVRLFHLFPTGKYQQPRKMHLPHALNTKTFEVKKDENVLSYAILSHRWQDNEVSFDMLRFTNLRENKKIHGACQEAEALGQTWIWVDSVCMDKSNAAEETKSLNSMFEWYRNAAVCLTYLWDVDASDASWKQQVQQSRWFTRGWTLQELLAPRNMRFYDRNWNFIGNKDDLKMDLHQRTLIDESYLLGKKDLRDASVATRMSWMAGRETKLIEDVAYAMLGILSVNMNPQYGEGVKAFTRLQRVLMESSNDESIFAWTTCKKGLKCYSRTEAWEPNSWGLLAPSPDCFQHSRGLVEPPGEEIEVRLGGGYRWTQQGVQFEVPQKSGTEATNWVGLPRKKIEFALNCWEYKDGRPHTVVIRLVKEGNFYKRVLSQELELVLGRRPSNNRVFGIEQVITRPLTVMQPAFT